MVSPPGGSSTLTTSAPHSPRKSAGGGPRAGGGGAGGVFPSPVTGLLSGVSAKPGSSRSGSLGVPLTGWGGRTELPLAISTASTASQPAHFVFPLLFHKGSTLSYF